MKHIWMVVLCLSSAPAFADQDFDKDVGYCAGLTASLAAASPENEHIQNAVGALAQLVKDNALTMDVDDSRKTAEAYTLVLKNMRGTVPDHENVELAAVVDLGLKSCKRIGVTIFPQVAK